MKVTTKRRAKKPARGQTLGATEFKAHCLELMDEVSRSGLPLTVTKRGKPVVRVIPASDDHPLPFGALKGAVVYMGDIISPTGEEWDAER
jgi:prevent-host-death family protein